eukprot:scaffold878_cov271-Pinguiococcus_pyrenoidosus.AAC.64
MVVLHVKVEAISLTFFTSKLSSASLSSESCGHVLGDVASLGTPKASVIHPKKRRRRVSIVAGRNGKPCRDRLLPRGSESSFRGGHHRTFHPLLGGVQHRTGRADGRVDVLSEGVAFGVECGLQRLGLSFGRSVRLLVHEDASERLQPREDVVGLGRRETRVLHLQDRLSQALQHRHGRHATSGVDGVRWRRLRLRPLLTLLRQQLLRVETQRVRVAGAAGLEAGVHLALLRRHQHGNGILSLSQRVGKRWRLEAPKPRRQERRSRKERERRGKSSTLHSCSRHFLEASPRLTWTMLVFPSLIPTRSSGWRGGPKGLNMAPGVRSWRCSSALRRSESPSICSTAVPKPLSIDLGVRSSGGREASRRWKPASAWCVISRSLAASIAWRSASFWRSTIAFNGGLQPSSFREAGEREREREREREKERRRIECSIRNIWL